MKSGVAIFSKQANPFPAPGKSRSHYHPSESQSLSEEQKHTVLSPVRLHHPLSEAQSPPEPGLPESDSSGPFDESWPSSEGSSRTPEQDTVMTRLHRGSDSADDPIRDESVIARYMARFRSGRPTSRLERSPPQPAEGGFWWLQTSPDSPDVQRLRPDSGVSASLGLSARSLEGSPPLAGVSLDDSGLHPEDVEIIGLHRKAGKLILQSESFLGSKDHLSSEALGSSSSSRLSKPTGDVSRVPSSSDVSRVQSFSDVSTVPSSSDVSRVRSFSDVSRMASSTLDTVSPVPALHTPVTVLALHTPVTVPALQAPVTAPALHTPVTVPAPSVRAQPMLPPEEDILYQWRLRRKMEQAREGTLPRTTRRRSPSPPVRIPKQVSPAADCCEPLHISRREPAELAPLPVRLQDPSSCAGHCPLASPLLAPSSHSCPVPPHLHLQCDVLPCVHSQQPGHCAQRGAGAAKPGTAPTEDPAHLSNGGHPAELQGQRHAPSEAIPHRRAHRRPQEAKVTSKGDKGRRKGGGSVRHVEAPPPASPVHQAMEQVISERLFASSPSPKMKSKKPAEAPHLPAQEKSEYRPLQIAAQLLQEAADSDGTEFVDDPLLQVLRKQRRSLRARLWAVDGRLAELEEAENKGGQSRALP